MSYTKILLLEIACKYIVEIIFTNRPAYLKLKLTEINVIDAFQKDIPLPSKNTSLFNSMFIKQFHFLLKSINVYSPLTSVGSAFR